MSTTLTHGRWGALALVLTIVACSETEDEPAVSAAANAAPTITGVPAPSIAPAASFTFAPAAADPDGDPLIFGIDGKPSWATFDASNGQLAGTPTAADAGTYRGIVIWVSDGAVQTLLPPFDLTVMSEDVANGAPVISGTPPTTAIAGSAYSFVPMASDPNGDTLTFSILNAPTWATFSAADGSLKGTPQADDVGLHENVTIAVSDGAATIALAAFNIGVSLTGVNSPPTITGAPPASIAAGNAYAFVPTTSDVDGDALTFSVSGLPPWAAFNTGVGALTGTPPASTTGTFADIVITVSDGAASASLAPFSIAVTAPVTNAAPTISGTAPATATQGVAYSFAPQAADSDGDPLTYTIANRPSWATFSTATGSLTGTPGASHVRRYGSIVIGVSDGKATAQLAAFSITVAAANAAPTISGTPPTTARVGTAYAFQPTAADANSNTLTFSITNKPAWASFNAASGRLSGTPAAANVGTFANIVIRVSDGQASAALPAFAIAVSPAPNAAPTISGTPATAVLAGTPYTFQPTAADSNNDSLTYSIANKPAWATFSNTTGRLQGTPAAGNVGTTSNIVISVSDGQAQAALPAFAIAVTAAANAAPTISGTAPTQVMQGTQYSFQPTANDPNGDVLTFAIANKPAWATFTAATGRLQGAPSAANVGTTSNIVISVSDGAASAALAAFSITVAPVALGSATLSWVPPTQNADGSPLNDLAGFKVYWGSAQNSLTSSVTINNAGVASHLVESLVPGTWFFAVTAFDANGNESDRSNVASKTIQSPACATPASSHWASA
jgi:hypothetical protein